NGFDIVDLNYQVFNPVNNLYISNKENHNPDIAINKDYEFNLEELIQDQDFE
ncbi:2948_t:CDS:1, partial [Dentiscutata heterogama]